jgi:integrase
MPHLSPQTLTTAEQEIRLEVSTVHPRDHLLISLALGTGLRLAEIVGHNVGAARTIPGDRTPVRAVIN